MATHTQWVVLNQLDKENPISPNFLKIQQESPFSQIGYYFSMSSTYLSEFFKLSLVGLWLGDEEEWPKRYSWRESIVGFFGLSETQKK